MCYVCKCEIFDRARLVVQTLIGCLRPLSRFLFSLSCHHSNNTLYTNNAIASWDVDMCIEIDRRIIDIAVRQFIGGETEWKWGDRIEKLSGPTMPGYPQVLLPVTRTCWYSSQCFFYHHYFFFFYNNGNDSNFFLNFILKYNKNNMFLLTNIRIDFRNLL